MKFQHAVLALAAMVSIGQAQAVTFDGAVTLAGNAVTNYSAGALLSFDIDFASAVPVTLNFTLDAADLSVGGLSFNALVRNLTGSAMDSAQVRLSGITFAAPLGTFTTDGFVAVASSGANSTLAWATFTPGVTTEYYVGNPLGTGGAADWNLSLQGMQAGDQFSVTMAVPEPQGYALALVGLSVVSLLARRRA